MKEVNKEFLELFYELEDIESVDNEGYSNMWDISVTGNETFLLGNGILSHNSAAMSISKILGRQGNGFFAMFGVPPNAYDSTPLELAKSKKMLDLKDILGLKFTQTEQDDLNFKNIIITTDFDLPGHFIAGQLLGLFYRYGKNLFAEGRIMRLVTPLLIAKDKNEKIVKWFYGFDDYVEFERKHKSKNYIYDYKKGLGSLTQEEMDLVINTDGLENMLEVFNLDDKLEDLIDAWLNGKRADSRKEMLDGYSFNIMNS